MAAVALVEGARFGEIEITVLTRLADGTMKIVASCNKIVKEFVFLVIETVGDIMSYIRNELT